MVQLHQDIAKFNKANIQVVAICPEDTDKIEKFIAGQPLDFTLIADPKHQLADQYNQQVKLLKLGRMPAQILIDQNRQKLLEHHAKNMADIVDNNTVIHALNTPSTQRQQFSRKF